MPAKPVLPPLKTPKTMMFPSELYESPLTAGPLTAGSDFIKREEGSSTPITPPQAYTEFLKALTPVFTSPVSANVEFPRFRFEKRRPSPISVPSSATSTVFSTRDSLSARDSPNVASATLPPPSPAPSPGPQSARLPTTLRRLRIPRTGMYSPLTDSPGSARTIRSPFSPSDWKIRYIETPKSAGGKSVSVRQVVTRTVTYKRTHLDPPPRGKRRKTSESQDI
ncbi:hypothetical protein CBS147326_2721 [Penicillium roqueforti]|nr:hypothetical protein CBS147354_1286 [Penicillium roqueforti]KAI3139043.1 hypothetical protein CBS147326_2721 [Penicillium roqueforti]KAI3231113.1 hypothetical protein CBS147310_6039 [Penicillium roqueforti]KAI3238739.1 hypothetical protein DTO012A9_6480 [Penicillium roqueforti]